MTRKYKLSKLSCIKLKNMRKETKLTIEEVSLMIGKSKDWLGQIERGKLQGIKKDDLMKLFMIYSKIDNTYSTDDLLPMFQNFVDGLSEINNYDKTPENISIISKITHHYEVKVFVETVLNELFIYKTEPFSTLENAIEFSEKEERKGHLVKIYEISEIINWKQERKLKN